MRILWQYGSWDLSDVMQLKVRVACNLGYLLNPPLQTRFLFLKSAYMGRVMFTVGLKHRLLRAYFTTSECMTWEHRIMEAFACYTYMFLPVLYIYICICICVCLCVLWRCAWKVMLDDVDIHSVFWLMKEKVGDLSILSQLISNGEISNATATEF